MSNVHYFLHFLGEWLIGMGYCLIGFLVIKMAVKNALLDFFGEDFYSRVKEEN